MHDWPRILIDQIVLSFTKIYCYRFSNIFEQYVKPSTTRWTERYIYECRGRGWYLWWTVEWCLEKGKPKKFKKKQTRAMRRKRKAMKPENCRGKLKTQNCQQRQTMKFVNCRDKSACGAWNWWLRFHGTLICMSSVTKRVHLIANFVKPLFVETWTKLSTAHFIYFLELA